MWHCWDIILECCQKVFCEQLINLRKKKKKGLNKKEKQKKSLRKKKRWIKIEKVIKVEKKRRSFK